MNDAFLLLTGSQVAKASLKAHCVVEGDAEALILLFSTPSGEIPGMSSHFQFGIVRVQLALIYTPASLYTLI